MASRAERVRPAYMSSRPCRTAARASSRCSSDGFSLIQKVEALLRGEARSPIAELGIHGLTGWDHACLEMSRFLAFWAPEMPENLLVSVQLTTFVVSGVTR